MNQPTWDFLPYMQEIGEAYAASQDNSSDPRVRAAWKALADDSVARAAQLDQQHNIKTVQFEPYETPEQQDYDVRNYNQFLVSDQNSDHPLWTVQQNVAFRKVHDLLGHLPSGGDFSWEGENRACGAHFKLLNPEARHALFVECIMQTAAVNVYRRFLDQKCFICPNFDPERGYIPQGPPQQHDPNAGLIYNGRGLTSHWQKVARHIDLIPVEIDQYTTVFKDRPGGNTIAEIQYSKPGTGTEIEWVHVNPIYRDSDAFSQVLSWIKENLEPPFSAAFGNERLFEVLNKRYPNVWMKDQTRVIDRENNNWRYLAKTAGCEQDIHKPGDLDDQHWGRVSSGVNDPLAHAYWEELTPRAQKAVAANAQPIYDELSKMGFWGPENCGEACALWEKAFNEAGIPVQVIEGNYNPEAEEGIEHPMSTDHVWMLVDGKLFDPTASQFVRKFNAPIDQSHYRTSGFKPRVAGWTDYVAPKAKRLKDEGKVRLLRNGIHNVVAEVTGDTGTYQVELTRIDPNSMAITGWSCECPWYEHAFGRTRKWKKYEGRMCSHAMATFWQSQASPLDEEADIQSPFEQAPAPGESPPAPIPGPTPPPDLSGGADLSQGSSIVPPGNETPGTISIPGTFSKFMRKSLDEFVAHQAL